METVTAAVEYLEGINLASITMRIDLEEVSQSQRASNQEIHQTYSMLFEMLSLSNRHRQHLKSPKRGLTDEQIN